MHAAAAAAAAVAALWAVATAVAAAVDRNALYFQCSQTVPTARSDGLTSPIPLQDGAATESGASTACGRKMCCCPRRKGPEQAAPTSASAQSDLLPNSESGSEAPGGWAGRMGFRVCSGATLLDAGGPGSFVLILSLDWIDFLRVEIAL
jgi:hypothetical protein